MSNKFTESAEKVLENALSLAEKFGHTYVGCEHLLLALAEDKDSQVAHMLAERGADNEKIKNAIEEYSLCGEETKLKPSNMTPMLRQILRNAVEISERYKDDSIKVEHILFAICEQERLPEEEWSPAVKILHQLGFDFKKIVF